MAAAVDQLLIELHVIPVWQHAVGALYLEHGLIIFIHQRQRIGRAVGLVFGQLPDRLLLGLVVLKVDALAVDDDRPGGISIAQRVGGSLGRTYHQRLENGIGLIFIHRLAIVAQLDAV